MATPDLDPQAIQSRLDAVLERAAADPAVPSALAFVSAPTLELEWCAALAGPLGRGAACSPQAPFRIASVTKLHTAATVLRLVEVGGLQLQDRMGPYLGAARTHLLRAGGHDPDRITVAHLLCHTSGLPDHAALPAYAEAVLASPTRRWTRDDQLGLALTVPPTSQAPGPLCQYSDTGYVLLGEIIERVTGKALGPAVRELLAFDRLGLRQTWWEDDEPEPAGTHPRARQWLGPVDVTGFVEVPENEAEGREAPALIGALPDHLPDDEPGGPPPKPRRTRRFTWRVLIFVVALLALAATVVGALVYYGRNTYYVAFDGDDQVTIFKGRPESFLIFDPTVERVTTISADDLKETAADRVRAESDQATLDDAEAFVDNLCDTLKAGVEVAECASGGGTGSGGTHGGTGTSTGSSATTKPS